jgi:AmmeMemoRadiSam system protein A
MLSPQQRERLLHVARQSLRHAVGLGSPPDLQTDDPVLTRPSGAFVTLKEGGDLRGCIGHIEALSPLIETVADMAQAAALEDPRFQPVSADEEPDIDIEISVLSPIEPCPDLEAIEIGRHGLIVSQGPYRGLLLPQVPVEWGWDRETFLRHTCQKAGLAPDAYLRGAKVYWFEAEVFGSND